MKITEDHWVDAATIDSIPGGSAMNVRRFLVIHSTSGATAKSSINYWRQLNSGICAHFVIDRDGTLYQCRPCNKTAGHAGQSKWRDPKTGKLYTNLNSCSIGIELANGGDNPLLARKWSPLAEKTMKARHKNGGRVVEWENYPTPQTGICFELAQTLVKRYNLDDVVGHEDIAPDRKVDPGPAFPMTELRAYCGFAAPLAKL